METAAFGATAKGGIRRLTLSEEDGRVRTWLADACREAGLEVAVDRLGSMFATRPGRDVTRKPIAFGSHLDTQPTGGKFDGVLGVLAGLEVIRTLNDARIETEAPLTLVNWTNEEGARFSPAMMASGVYAGALDEDYVLSRTDLDQIAVADALDAIGFRGEEPVGAREFAAFLELHIEQGPILEAEGTTIGVVTGAQALAWYDGRIEGRERHAGTTPMGIRKDPLAAFSEVVLAIERIARDHGPAGVGTVGSAQILPNSRNTIPGEVRFQGEFRHPDNDELDAMDAELMDAIEEIAARRGIAFDLERIWRKEAVVFDDICLAAIEEAAETAGFPHRRMISGAGHDACNVAMRAPTAMIFVPCRGGVSHAEDEDASENDCAAGAQVLLGTVLNLDRTLNGSA